ncbi:MAG: lysophospholipid acyltransferase family protein [Myxococcales bacterium]|nr:lysophospholipid acyltransferase family protein [Myxococcales bacterium]
MSLVPKAPALEAAPAAAAHLASWPKRLKRAVRYFFLRCALALVGLLPAKLAGRLGESFGALAFALARRERRKALASLSMAFPELGEAERRSLARACFRHLGRCAFELSCVRQLDSRVEEWVEWPEADRKVLEAALGKGRGVVFVSGHVGNWELLARRVALAGFPCQTIAKEATDLRLTRLIERFRSSAGLRSIWRGQPGAVKQMLRSLKAGEILGLLIDQDTKVQSVFVPFFGRPASTPRAAADLALRTGAAVVLGFCHRQAGGKYRLSMREVAAPDLGSREEAVHSLTALLSSGIESAIRQAPEQWVWMHQRWKTRPAPA